MSTARPGRANAADRESADDETFKAGLLELIPFLRAFARSLCGNTDMADDLAQEALVKAWQSRSSFAAGTNLKAWLFTILRNQFYSDRRRAGARLPGTKMRQNGFPARRRNSPGQPSCPTPRVR